MKKMKQSFIQKHPHYIKLPKDARSPTDSIYYMYDIVKQGKVLSRWANDSYIVRSSEPFTLRFLTKGKVKEVSSRLNRK